MVSPYKEVIEKALKSKCVKLNNYYFFVGAIFINSQTKNIVEWDSQSITENLGLGAELTINLSGEDESSYQIGFREA